MKHQFPEWIVPLIVHAAATLPLALLLHDYLSGGLAPNPAQALEQRSGRIAITLLTATLAVSPLAGLLRQPVILKARRLLGLYAFGVVALHFILLVGFDFRFNVPLLVDTYLDKPFTWFGMLTALILLALALTSTGFWMQRLGKWWVRLHRLVYLAAMLDLAHYFLAVKGSLLTFSGNLMRPLTYAMLILALLLLRLFQFRKSRSAISRQ